MEIIHEFFGREYLIDFEIKITAEACKATGPSYDSGGEPASPMEWEIDGDPQLFSLKQIDVSKGRLVDGKWQSVTSKEWVRDRWLELPCWLREAVTDWLHESDDVACMAEELAADDGPDPDDARDRAYDDER